MNEEEILIIGSKGQLGKALSAKYPNARKVDSDELDITNNDALLGFDWSKVSIILNAAAYTNVDGAESEDGRKMAWKINAEAVKNLSAICIKYDIKIIHISTDYVFDGTNAIHEEIESFSPLGVYGQSKAAGDLVITLVPKHYVLRTSWVIGDGHNFVRTMLDLAKRNISPKVVSDQIGRLTFTSELVRAIDFLIANGSPFGIYNLSNEGKSVSWSEVARKIFEIGKFNEIKVQDISTREYFKDKDDIAPRPLQSTLSLDKIHKLGFKSRNWEEDLIEYIKKELNK